MVTTAHVAGVPVRNANAADFGKHYGTTILTCAPADPATKGGVEAAVKLAKADLVPTGANLRAEYGTFAEVEQACAQFTEAINAKTHAVTKEEPVQRFEQEKALLHPTTPASGCWGCRGRTGRARKHSDGVVRERPILRARPVTGLHGQGAGHRPVSRCPGRDQREPGWGLGRGHPPPPGHPRQPQHP